MGWHFIFDTLAYGLGIFSAWYFYRETRNYHPFPVPESLRKWYYFSVSWGALIGSFFFGTMGGALFSETSFFLGKSVLGALIGGIIGAEIFKLRHHIRISTGLYFVPALTLGIAVGRIGCFLAGIPDNTYGIPTDLPWGYDFGDGVLRHPVQLYESLFMFGFFLAFVSSYSSHRLFWITNGFPLFAVFYGLERFLLEFLKPYPGILGTLNSFHILAICLFLYGVSMLIYTRTNTVKLAEIA